MLRLQSRNFLPRFSSNETLRFDENFVYTFVQNQCSLAHLPAVINLRGIRASVEAAGTRGKRLCHGITLTCRRRILLGRFFWCDRLWDNRIVCSQELGVAFIGQSQAEESKSQCGNEVQISFHSCFDLGELDGRPAKLIQKCLRSCAMIRPAFSNLLSPYSFSKTRNLSSSIRCSNAR
jgi:hypothetical protein